MKKALLFLAFAILYCNFTLAQEPELDPNLLWVTEQGYNSFIIHPNGNIIASKGLEVAELDGNTGEIIREFPFYFDCYALSPDGRYIIGGKDSLLLIDYTTGEVIKKIKVNLSTKLAFYPDNETLLLVSQEMSDGYDRRLYKHNFMTDETTYFGYYEYGFHNITISQNGKYFAVGGTHEENSQTVTHLMIWNAETLEPIKVLGVFENSNEVRSIKFSPDSRLVGFVVSGHGLYIYHTDNYSLNKFYGSAYGVGFVSNDFIAIGTYWNQLITFEIINLKDGKPIYKRNDFTGIAKYNVFNNTLIVNYSYLYCFDFEKILSGASIEPKITNQFMVEYKNNTLLLKNYNFTTVQITAQIVDINGKMIRQLELNTSTSDFRIPIKLISGTYFLHIKDGGKEYVAKFLVIN